MANPKRAPLLLTAGGKDYTSTASMVRSMCKKHSRAPARTDLLTFAEPSHWLIAEPSWDEVADGIAQWIGKLGYTGYN